MYKTRPLEQNWLLSFTKKFALQFWIAGLLILCNFQSGIAQQKHIPESAETYFALNENVENIDGVEMRKKLKRLLSIPQVKLFLATIKRAEAGEPNLMVGGCRAKNLKKHPGEVLPQSCWFPIYIDGVKRFASSAGNYQITLENWRKIAPFLKLRDFSEENQALAALELMRRGGGAANAYTKKGLKIKNSIQKGFLALAVNRNLKTAFKLSTYDWASSANSPLPVPAGFIKIDYYNLLKKVK